MQNRRKVFGIGVSRTGSTTLRKCFSILGYSHEGPREDLLRMYLNGEAEGVMEHIESIDFAKDYPWAMMYKELDARFPDSMFVLTLRANEDVWYESLCKLWQEKGSVDMLTMVFGQEVPFGNKEKFVKLYNDHNRNVREYFDGRSNFVEVCWEDGDGWAEICKFVDIDFVPDKPFPHRNASPNILIRYYLRVRRPFKGLKYKAKKIIFRL